MLCRSKLILILCVVLLAQHSLGAKKCQNIYNHILLTPTTKIEFSQNYLGHVWASAKASQLAQELLHWKSRHDNLGREYFIHEYSRRKPFPVIRDISGQIRLIDSHHSFFAISMIMKNHGPFSVNIKLVKDYTRNNPQSGKPWSKKEMMRDLVKKNYISIYGKLKPDFSDLRNLPKSIFEMPDMPERTILSMVLKSLELPMKGSDFKPMIQILMAQKMEARGITVITDKPYHDKNIHRIKNELLASREFLEFLILQINPDKPIERTSLVRRFLTQKISEIPSAS